MIAHISADRTRVDIVAIPRDTMIPLPGCTRPGGSQASARSRAQLNEAFGHGANTDAANKNEGVACVIEAVESVTNVLLDSFILVEFAGFAHVIDALGGVNICLPDGMKSHNAGLDLEAGEHHLDGPTALQFARARDAKDAQGKPLSDGSDVQRISQQQQLIATVINEALTSGSLKSIGKLNSTATAITKSLYVGQELGSVVDMAGLAYALRDIKMENVSLFTIPWAQDPVDSNRVVLAGYGTASRFGGLNAEEVFARIATDQPIPGTTPYKVLNAATAPDPSSPASADPSSGNEAAPPLDATPTPDEEFVTPVEAPVTCRVEGAGSTG
jgi:LCP family protein required for cell wall assembly